MSHQDLAQIAASLARIDRAGAELLTADLELVLTFLDAVSTSDDPHVRRRNHERAREAMGSVLRLLQRLETIDEQSWVLRARLEAVQRGLQKHHEQVAH